MSILVAMPQWAVPSELWLQRMIEFLEPHVAAIATHEPPESRWRGRIPSIEIPYVHRPKWLRAARRLGISIPDRSGAYQFIEAVARLDVKAVLVHYLPFALELEDVWETTDKPVFVHSHGYDVTWDLRWHEDPAKKFFQPYYLPAVRRLCHRVQVIANSRHAAERLLSVGIPPERVIVKYMGVPVAADPPAHRVRPVDINILFLGRLIDCKGPDLTIQAFERACGMGLKAHLTLAGDGPMRETCEALRVASTHAERITLLGAVNAETGARLRAEADIFTAHNCLGPLSRQEESLGVSILEAMAEALPVVTGRSGGVLETVVHEETGLLIEPGDVEAHARALLRLGQDAALRRRMGEAGWRRVHDSFSIERERDQLLGILGLAEKLDVTIPSHPQPPPATGGG